MSGSGVTPAPEERPAYLTMRRAADVLITGSEPLRVRLQLADRILETLDPQTELLTKLERCLYGRIASSLVSGGPEDDDDEDDEEESSREALDESIAMLDDDIAVLIARDVLRLYELTAGPPDESRDWPQERWPDDQRP